MGKVKEIFFELQEKHGDNVEISEKMFETHMREKAFIEAEKAEEIRLINELYSDGQG